MIQEYKIIQENKMSKASVRFKFYVVLHLGYLTVLFMFPILCWSCSTFISVMFLDGTYIVQLAVWSLLSYCRNLPVKCCSYKIKCFSFLLIFLVAGNVHLPGIGMDTCVIPLRHGGLSLVQTTDYIYPIVDDPYMMVSLGLRSFVIGTILCIWF